MSHTYNGEPVLACGHTAQQHEETGTVWCVLFDLPFPLHSAIQELRQGLRDTLQMLDEERAGTKSRWTSEDLTRLEEIRALVRE